MMYFSEAKGVWLSDHACPRMEASNGSPLFFSFFLLFLLSQRQQVLISLAWSDDAVLVFPCSADKVSHTMAGKACLVAVSTMGVYAILGAHDGSIAVYQQGLGVRKV